MPKITIDITDATPAQVAAIMGILNGKPTHAAHAPKLYHAGPAPGQGKPAPVENPEQYLREPGSPTGIQGHPYKLTDEGLKKVWTLHKLGYSTQEIFEGFKRLITTRTINRIIAKVRAANR